MSKLAEIPPVACAGCGGQYTDRRHVDFESAWDGPTFEEFVHTGDGGKVRNLVVAIDDLFLCEECMAEGAKLLGFVKADEQAQRLIEAEEQLTNLRERIAEREDYIVTLERAVAAKPSAKPRKKAEASA